MARLRIGSLLAWFLLAGSACPTPDHECLGDDPPAGCPNGPPSCDQDPTAEGCRCGGGDDVTVCHEGPAGTAGVGECVVGLRRCAQGVWGKCLGQGLPQGETCDQADNDCDGEVDEGVLSICGDCNQDCTELAWGHGPGETAFDPSTSNSVGVGLRKPGALVLLGDEIAVRVLWVSNSPEGTVSLVDTSTRKERARYRTGPDSLRDDPSRTSVSIEGHAYIGNRARYGLEPGQGAIVKILEHDCPDLDGNGSTETSSGGEDVLEWGRDECVAWRTILPGAVRAVAAQVKLDDGAIHEVVWAGTTEDGRFYELDGESGERTGLETVLPECVGGVYGAALDRDGTMWVSCFFTRGFARFDTFEPERTEHFISANPYGITVAADGRVWSSDGHVFDPFDESVVEVPGVDNGKGISADRDGSIWIGKCGLGTCRVNADTLEVSTYPMVSRGIAVDFDGFIWGVSDLVGTLSVMDAATEMFETVLDDCDGPCLVRPYTYSDMTGTQLRNVMNPLGTWETLVEGCTDERVTHWLRLEWDADVPIGASLRMQVRAADGLTALSLRPWVDVATIPPETSPASLEDVLGDHDDDAFLAVRVILETVAPGRTPVLHRIGVQRNCGELIR